MYFSTRNPVSVKSKLRVGLSVNGGVREIVYTAPAGYKPGMHGSRDWGREVLERVRVKKTDITVVKGMNKIRIYGGDPNIILEKLVAYPKGHEPAKTYLGAPESYYVK